MFLISSWSCLCSIHWSQVLSQESRCSWSSTDRRCSNYIWMINNFIATMVQLILEVWGIHFIFTRLKEVIWKYEIKARWLSFWLLRITLHCCYNAISFLSNSHNGYPITGLRGQGMGFVEGILPKGPYRHAYVWQIGPFWQDTLVVWVLPLSLLCHTQFYVILDCVIMVPDCIVYLLRWFFWVSVAVMWTLLGGAAPKGNFFSPVSLAKGVFLAKNS